MQRFESRRRGRRLGESNFSMHRFESCRPELRVLSDSDSEMQSFESCRPNQSVRSQSFARSFTPEFQSPPVDHKQSNSDMQRFESCRPRLRVWRIPILRCRGSNPPASTGQSVSNAYGIGSQSKCREMGVSSIRISSPRAETDTDAGIAVSGSEADSLVSPCPRLCAHMQLVFTTQSSVMSQ
jgi:hypothetical protein